MSLEGLVEAKRLKKEETSADEITGLVGVVERSIRDAKVEAISDDLRFIAAYNALLNSATVALRRIEGLCSSVVAETCSTAHR